MNDYYALLGVSANVGHAELRRAWRRLALRWHPDRAGSGATATFQKIQAAYAVLSDAASRAAYDRRQSTPVRGPRRAAPGVMLHRLTGSLAGLLACGIAVRLRDDMIELFINPDEAEAGGMITISMRVPVRKPDRQVVDDIFAAWLAVPPGVRDGEILPPSAYVPGMIHRVLFRVRLNAA